MSFMKKLTSALVASSLVLGLVSTAFAAPSADEVNEAYTRLSYYSIVQGIPGEGPALEKPITRAQLLTILTRAWGQEDNAKLLAGATTGFSDVDGVADVSWTTGYIFIGNRIAETNGGQKLGTSATTFAPSADLTAVQTLAFTMKFLGLTVGTGDNWVADTIKAAKDAGLITDADEAKYLANPNAVVNRGQAFALLDTMFASYNKLEGGNTIYTAFIDDEAPVLTVNKPELTTDMAALTITGSVKGEFKGVYLGSEMITVNEDGTFSVEVALVVGANTITVTAMDMVGNTAEESFTVTRNAGAPAKIAATMAGEIVAGETVDVTVTVTDANGVELEVAAADITSTVGGSVGTYADGKFTAAEKVGAGTLTFSYGDLTPATVDVKVVAGPLAQILGTTAVSKGETVTLTPADKFENAIASGVTYTWEGTGIAVTSGGVVYTSASGVYKITAKAGEATAETTVGVYGDIASLKVSLPETIVANGETRKAVTVTAVDEFGNAIASYGDGDDTLEVKVESSGVKFFEDEDTEDEDYDADAFYAAFEHGVATVLFAVDSALAGEELVFTATLVDDEEITAEATTDAVMPVASALKISSSEKFFPANSPDTQDVLVVVVDQEGVEVDEAYEITGTITGPAEFSGGDTKTYVSPASGSEATFTISNSKSVGVEGTITLTFTAEGIGSVTGEIKHVIAGNPAKFSVTSDKDSKSADDPIEFTVEVQDRNGVPVAFDAEKSITLKLSADTAKFAVDDDADAWDEKAATIVLPVGEKDVTFELSTVDKFTGSVTATLSLDTGSTVYGVLTGSKTVSFTAGSTDQVSLDRDVIWAPVATPTATLVASLADANGNTVAKADVELEVYVSGDMADTVTVNGVKATTDKKLTVKTDANGQVKLEIKARPYANEDYEIWVANADTPAQNDKTDLAIKETVVASIATKLYKEVQDGENTKYISATSVVAGDVFYVVATVKDNYGGEYVFGALNKDVLASLLPVADEVLDVDYALADDDDDLLTDNFEFVAAGDPSVSDFAGDTAINLADKDGVYIAKLVAGKAGVTSIGASYEKGQSEISKTSSVQFKPGDAVEVVVNGDDAIEVDDAGVVYGPFTVSIADYYGNTVALTKTASITFAPDLSGLSFRKTESGATVDTFSTKSSTSFYLVSTADDETYTVTITATATVDGVEVPLTGSFTVIVGEGE